MQANGSKSKLYSNINDLLADANRNPKSVLAVENIGAQLDMFAKSGEHVAVLKVLKTIGKAYPEHLKESDFLESLLCSMRNGPLFNQCFGNMSDVSSVEKFIEACNSAHVSSVVLR